jgi:hypothetical protein
MPEGSLRPDTAGEKVVSVALGASAVEVRSFYCVAFGTFASVLSSLRVVRGDDTFATVGPAVGDVVDPAVVLLIVAHMGLSRRGGRRRGRVSGGAGGGVWRRLALVSEATVLAAGSVLGGGVGEMGGLLLVTNGALASVRLLGGISVEDSFVVVVDAVGIPRRTIVLDDHALAVRALEVDGVLPAVVLAGAADVFGRSNSGVLGRLDRRARRGVSGGGRLGGRGGEEGRLTSRESGGESGRSLAVLLDDIADSEGNALVVVPDWLVGGARAPGDAHLATDRVGIIAGLGARRAAFVPDLSTSHLALGRRLGRGGGGSLGRRIRRALVDLHTCFDGLVPDSVVGALALLHAVLRAHGVHVTTFSGTSGTTLVPLLPPPTVVGRLQGREGRGVQSGAI